MTYFPNSGVKLSTLHFWLSLVELALLLLSLVGLYAAIHAARIKRTQNAALKLKPLPSVWKTTFDALDLRLKTFSTAWALWHHKLRELFRKWTFRSGRVGNCGHCSFYQQGMCVVFNITRTPKDGVGCEKFAIIPRNYATAVMKTLAFAAAFVLGFGYNEYRHSVKYPVYDYDNVEVLQQTGNQEWIMRIDGMKIRWNCCPDFDCSTVIWPGYVMRKFRYEQHGGCGSILNPKAHPPLGAFWKTEHGDVVKIKEEETR
jgi:hypothetical protein